MCLEAFKKEKDRRKESRHSIWSWRQLKLYCQNSVETHVEVLQRLGVPASRRRRRRQTAPVLRMGRGNTEGISGHNMQDVFVDVANFVPVCRITQPRYS